MTEVNIGRKVAWGAVWSIALNVVSRGLGLISILILSRLITPYDLGVYAAATIVIELVYVLTEVGIYPVLIHRKNPDTIFYQTAWTVQVVRGFIIFMIVQLFTEYFIHIYSNDEAIHDVIQVVSITILLNAFSSIYLVNFQKNIDFKGLMKFNLTCRLIGFFATIIAAFILQSFWALAIGNIILACTRLALSHIYAPGPHRFTFKSSRELLNVSRWLLIHEIASFISLKSDTFLITRFLGAKTLGIYEVGYQVAMAPTQEIALPVSRALFPGLAKLQDNKEKFSDMFTITIGSIIYISLPAGVGLIMVADSLVASLLPENWHGAAEVIQILAIFGIFRVVFGPCVSALMGSGNMALSAKLTLLNMVMRSSALSYGVINHGFEGLLIASAIVSSVTATLYITVLTKMNMLDITQLLRMIWRPILATAFMAMALQVFSESTGLLQANSGIGSLLSSIAIGFIVYFVTIFIIWGIIGKPSGIEKILYDRLARYLS